MSSTFEIKPCSCWKKKIPLARTATIPFVAQKRATKNNKPGGQQGAPMLSKTVTESQHHIFGSAPGAHRCNQLPGLTSGALGLIAETILGDFGLLGSSGASQLELSRFALCFAKRLVQNATKCQETYSHGGFSLKSERWREKYYSAVLWDDHRVNVAAAAAAAKACLYAVGELGEDVAATSSKAACVAKQETGLDIVFEGAECSPNGSTMGL
jgi:hypothetical protein